MCTWIYGTTGPPRGRKRRTPETQLSRALKDQRQPAQCENHQFRVTGQARTIAGLVAVRCALSAASWEWLRWIALHGRAAA
jgi:hypothetical protein